MNIPFVNLDRQIESIKSEINSAIQQVIQSKAFILGSFVQDFEKNFAAAIGVKHCIAVGNGTDGLFLILKAMGIGHGDEVITAANSFIATSEAITATGADVVFVDCDRRTYNIDISSLQEKITRKTKVIVPVHLYGQPAAMDNIIDITRRSDIRIVEDCAQAHLAEYKNRKVGTIGECGMFSFFPGKNLGAFGDAGAVVTNNDELALKIRMLANHGRIGKYDHEFEGFNSRMDGIQGAILNVKLKYLDKWTNHRRLIAKRYFSTLTDVKDIILPYSPDYVKHVYHLFVIRTRQRDRLADFLTNKGIATGVHYPIALPNLKAYSYIGHTPEDFPNASQFQNEYLSLPICSNITEDEAEYVITCIKSYFS